MSDNITTTVHVTYGEAEKIVGFIETHRVHGIRHRWPDCTPYDKAAVYPYPLAVVSGPQQAVDYEAKHGRLRENTEDYLDSQGWL